MRSARLGRRQPSARQVSKKVSPAIRQKRETSSLLKGDWSPPATARTVGYARVSTEDQNLDMQLTLLRQAGVTDDVLYVEKVSAMNAKRPLFHLMMKFIERGDTLVVYALSRLSRDLKTLLTLVDGFNDSGVRLKSVTEHHIDPNTSQGRLLISITGAVDENERQRIRERTRDGMQELKRQGMYLGRPRLVTPAIARQMRAMRYRQKRDVQAIATHFGVKPSTVYANTKR